MAKFFTNQNGNTLLKRLQDILKYHQNIEFLEFLVGYFRISGFKYIADLIDNKKTRILVGIDIDSLTLKAEELGKNRDIFLSNQALDKFKDEALNEIKNSKYSYSVEESILLLAKYIKEKKLEIRIHPDKNIHAKVYILREEIKYDNNIEQKGSMITGSSNLTIQGLSKNYEFNVELNSSDEIEFALNEFNSLWSGSIEISENDIAEVKDRSYLREVTPFEIYIKFLIENFDDIIDEEINFIPKDMHKLSYQIQQLNNI